MGKLNLRDDDGTYDGCAPCPVTGCGRTDSVCPMCSASIERVAQASPSWKPVQGELVGRSHDR